MSPTSLSLCLFFLCLCAGLIQSKQSAQEEPKRCHQVKLLQSIDETVIPGTWYVSVVSENVPLRCFVATAKKIADHTYEDTGKFWLHGKQHTLSPTQWKFLHEPTGVRVLADETGFFPSMINVIHFEKDVVVYHHCGQTDGSEEDSVLVFSRSPEVDKTTIQRVMKENNLDDIRMINALEDCPKEALVL